MGFSDTDWPSAFLRFSPEAPKGASPQGLSRPLSIPARRPGNGIFRNYFHFCWMVKMELFPNSAYGECR